MIKTKLNNASQLVVGETYIFRNVKRHPFCLNPEGKEFKVKSNSRMVVTGTFDGVEQIFMSERMGSGDFEIHRKPLHPTKLSRQCRILLRHLQRSNITQRQALMDHSIMALPRRIADLKEAGYNIETVMKVNAHTGQRYAAYYLAD